MRHKAKRPVAKCKFLFNQSPARGWGDVDDSTPPANSGWDVHPPWTPSVGPTPLPTKPEIPHLAGRRRPVTRRHVQRCECVLLFWVPEEVHYITRSECKAVWPEAKFTLVSPKKLQVQLTPEHDVERALDLRTVLGTRLLVQDCRSFFSGIASFEALLGKLRHQAPWMSWEPHLRTWAVLSADRVSFDSRVDVEYWYPHPSFDVVCETPSGDRIINYDELAKAFGQGLQTTFKHWQRNPNSPDLKVVLEIEEADLKVLLETKPDQVVEDPFAPPFAPIRGSAVAHVMIRMAELTVGDFVVNSGCAGVDVGGEIMLSASDYLHVTLCDSSPVAVEQAVQYASQWSDAQTADGVVSETTELPFRDGVADVMFAFLAVTSTRDRQSALTKQDQTRLLTKQLQEIARVLKLETGRVCFLTREEEVLDEILAQRRANWSALHRTRAAFHGFNCFIYVLSRSGKEVTPSTATGPLRFRHRAKRETARLSPSALQLDASSPDAMDWNCSV